MNKNISRLISILLIFIILFNVISPNVVVYATDSEERAANFLNFYQDSSSVELNMQNLTTNDYYAMFNYMSNWYKPGTTTLYDVTTASGDFYSSFETALGKSGDEQLKALVQAFGADVVSGINSGKCLIVDSSGNRVKGPDFIKAIYNATPTSSSGFDGHVVDFNSSKLYFENNSNIAFDFGEDAIHAAFQTVFAYNPDMFLMDYGIASLDVFFLDAVGNLWGGTESCIDPDYVWGSGYSQGNCLDDSEDALKSVYLILPACLNPSAFTPGASSQSELRMPLMNRFVLSAIVTQPDLTADGETSISSKLLPIYEALSYINPTLKTSLLNVVGVHALSPYTFNMGGITGGGRRGGGTWTTSKRQQNLADFMYNPKSFVVEADTSNNGILSDYATNSYIVFAMSLEALEGANGELAEDGVLDLYTGPTSAFSESWGNVAFSVTKSVPDIASLVPLQHYLAYFSTPTVLDLAHVSMNFYDYVGVSGDESDFSSQFADYLTSSEGTGGVEIVSTGSDGLTSSEVSKMGLNGMSLFLNDIKIEIIQPSTSGNNTYYLLSPDNMVYSRLTTLLSDSSVEHKLGVYEDILSGKILPSSNNLTNILYLNKYNTTSSRDSGTSLYKVLNLSGESSLGGSFNNTNVLTAEAFKEFLNALNGVGVKLIYQDELEEIQAAGTEYYSNTSIKDIGYSLGSIYDYNYIEGYSDGYGGYHYSYSGPPTSLSNQTGFSSSTVWNELNGISTGSSFAKLDMENELPIVPYFVTTSDEDGNIINSGVSSVRIFLNQGNATIGVNNDGEEIYTNSVVYLGSSTLGDTKYIVSGRLLGGANTKLFSEFANYKTHGENNKLAGKIDIILNSSDSFRKLCDYIMALYGYNLFFPSNYLFDDNALLSNNRNEETLGAFGKTSGLHNSESGIKMRSLNGDYLMGMYLGYMVDMMGLSSCDSVNGVRYGNFNSKFLPSYTISAKGGNLNINNYMGDSATGVTRSEDTSFEEMQKDLISRIYGLTSSEPNSYRDGLIINILNGVILAIHRTITGTWGSSISTVTSGSSNTYQNVTGYIYTPTLEELPFTATMLDNYLEIYILCMLFVIFILVLMVLLHMRSWREGLLTCIVMSFALLLPYILISNCVNVGNKISDSMFSDRFDFWALIDHSQKNTSLTGYNFIDEKDQWYAEANATADSDITGNTGVKIKWMSPKKVDNFQQLYSNSDYSSSFTTNMTIFKWLFNSTIYDSEFVDTDVYGSYVYREYTTIALEAESYYSWGQALKPHVQDSGDSINYNGNSYTVPVQFAETLSFIGEDNIKYFAGGIGRLDSSFYTESNAGSKLTMSVEKLDDISKVSQSTEGYYSSTDLDSDRIGLWGMLSDTVSIHIRDLDTDVNGSGIISNLPTSSMATDEFSESDDPNLVSQAIFLKNTESPYYYFYSVLKSRYSDGASGSFKNALLRSDMFKIDVTNPSFSLNTTRSINGSVRDFLDLEGLFEYVIPYLKLSNDYVEAWQEENGSEIPDYNFKYNVDPVTGEAIDIGIDKATGNITDGADVGGGVVDVDYQKVVQDKNARNRVWNMYSPWVDSLYSLDISERISFVNKNITIQDTLNPYAYFEHGRPMIFSEADMIAKGYNYSDLTEVERKLQAVLENTYEDLLYLINYYSLDDEVLLSAAAMYATFNFNAEFSDNNFLQPSIMLYPQSFELRNFNYDAYIRLALLNTTGESIFAEQDLYERVIEKTSIFTGILLIVSDLVACILIPLIKFIMLVALLFLGLLICISCVLTPPEKLYQNTLKYILVPTFAFTALNVIFSFCMSLVVGEGLTAYVGSKSVNLATNDPTTTLFIMALFGVAYVFVAFKILKMIIEAYKQFGLSSVISTIGVVSSAFTTAATKATRKGAKLLGGGISTGAGALVGAVTSEKGHRVEGAFEGGHLGTTGVINRRIQDRRYKDIMSGNQGLSPSSKITSSIDAKAQNSASETKIDTATTRVNETVKPAKEKAVKEMKTSKETVKAVKESVGDLAGKLGKKASSAAHVVGTKVDGITNADWGTKIETSSELHGGFKSGADAKMSGLDKAMSKAAYVASRAEDTWSEVKYRGAHIGLTLKDFKTTAKGSMAMASDKLDARASQFANNARRVAGDVKAGVELTPDYAKAGARAVGRGISRTAGDVKAGAQLAGEAVVNAPRRAKKYLGSGLATYKQERQYHKETSIASRDSARVFDVANRGKDINERARQMDTHLEARKVEKQRRKLDKNY